MTEARVKANPGFSMWSVAARISLTVNPGSV